MVPDRRPAIGSKRTSTALRPIERSLAISLLRAREAVMARFRPVLRRHGVTEQQWRVIRVLAERRSCDATALAAASCILPASLSRILRALQESAVLQARPANADSRRLVVQLAPAGQRLFEEIGVESEAAYRGIERALGKRELDRTLARIHRLAARLGETASEGRPARRAARARN
jgi:homoprotocatechuate degradation regulator HpaR